MSVPGMSKGDSLMEYFQNNVKHHLEVVCSLLEAHVNILESEDRPITDNKLSGALELNVKNKCWSILSRLLFSAILKLRTRTAGFW